MFETFELSCVHTMEPTFDPSTGLFRAGNLAMSIRLSDDLLATAYLRFKQEETLPTIYYERQPSICEYLQQVMQPEHISLGGFVDRRGDGKAWDFAGICWVFDRQELGNGLYKAETGFGFFKDVATSREKVELGKLAVALTFSAFNIDVLFGATPTENRAARRFARSVGFDMSPAPIKNFISWEGALSDAWISSLTKKDWMARTRPILERRPDLDEVEFEPRQLAEGAAA